MAVESGSEPQVIEVAEDARGWVLKQRAAGLRVAFVPTMGALHEGHLALVRRGAELADLVAVSIFVNPTQFAPHEDFSRYPRTWQEDLRLLRQEGVKMVFAPGVEQMYGPRFSTSITPPRVAEPFEGRLRPDHFRGVCTVVLKLFQIVPADVAVFGQKDYQQARVIADMVADLNLPIELDVFPTVRDSDGLALSSRNRYLPPEARERALALSRALASVDRLRRDGGRDPVEWERRITEELRSGGVDEIDYAAVVDPVSLLPLTELLPARDSASAEASAAPVAVALIAARVAGTRLLDNLLVY